jgi:hypothetical protein
MAKSEKESFYYKVEQLEELVMNQQKALQMANNLLDLKGKLVDLCEEEVEIYKKEYKRLKRSLWIAFGWIVIRTTIDIISLLS